MKHIVYGLHSVEALLSKHPERVLHVYLQENKIDKSMEVLFKNQKIPYDKVNHETLDKLTQHGNHQGIAATCVPIRTYTENDLKAILQTVTSSLPLLLILDGVQDPHNLGACLRCCDAAGVTAVLAPKDRSAGLTA